MIDFFPITRLHYYEIQGFVYFSILPSLNLQVLFPIFRSLRLPADGEFSGFASIDRRSSQLPVRGHAPARSQVRPGHVGRTRA